MRIAIPVTDASGQIVENFSDGGTFALYDIHDETRAVQYLGRQSLVDPGCARTPGFLREHSVEVVMAHRISENAVSTLLESGIIAIKDAPSLPSDALIAHLVSGTLQATPPEGSTSGASCSPGSCGHCCGGSGRTASPCADHSSQESAAACSAPQNS